MKRVNIRECLAHHVVYVGVFQQHVGEADDTGRAYGVVLKVKTGYGWLILQIKNCYDIYTGTRNNLC